MAYWAKCQTWARFVDLEMPEARPARPLGKRRAFLRERWDFVKVPGSRIENDRGKPLSLGIRHLEAPASAFWCLVGWWFTRLGRVASSARTSRARFQEGRVSLGGCRADRVGSCTQPSRSYRRISDNYGFYRTTRISVRIDWQMARPILCSQRFWWQS